MEVENLHNHDDQNRNRVRWRMLGMGAPIGQQKQFDQCKMQKTQSR